MTDQPDPTDDAPRYAQTFEEVEDALLSRWPETRMEPSLDRIRAFTELLGDPQRTYPVIHLTGTNGKTSTSRMIDTLLRALELRTGRFTSPHVERMTERISLDGEPLTDEQFVRAFNDVAPYIAPRRRVRAAPAVLLRDRRRDGVRRLRRRAGRRRHRRGRPRRHVGRHQRRRRDRRRGAPGRGRPRPPPGRRPGHHRRREGRDHQARLDRRGRRAAPRRGRRDPRPRRPRSAPGSCARASTSVSPPAHRPSAVRWCPLQTPRARYDEVFLPLYGAHQAQNAAVALAAVEAFLGTDPLDAELVARGLRRGHLARPARDHPAQPDDRARRRAQPARRRGDGGGARGLLPARPR